MSNPKTEYKPSTHTLSNEDLASVTAGAFDAFVNFGDIKGESTDKDHKDWISILSYDHKVTQPSK